MKEAIEQAKDLVSDMCLPTPDHITAIETLILHSESQEKRITELKAELQRLREIDFVQILSDELNKGLLDEKETGEILKQQAQAISTAILGEETPDV